MSQVEVLRQLAAASAVDIAGIDAHITAIVEIVEGVERRWKKNCNAGGDPRLHVRHFGKLACRFNGELASVVISRLSHELHAEHSPFTTKVRADLELRAVGQHDLAVVEAHCMAFESENNRRLRA